MWYSFSIDISLVTRSNHILFKQFHFPSVICIHLVIFLHVFLSAYFFSFVCPQYEQTCFSTFCYNSPIICTMLCQEYSHYTPRIFIYLFFYPETVAPGLEDPRSSNFVISRSKTSQATGLKLHKAPINHFY